MLRLAAACSLLFACAQINRADPVEPGLQAHHHPGARQAARGELRVATYNVHGESAREIFTALERSRQLADLDVLFLQEIERDAEDTPRALAALLGMSVVYAPGYGLGPRGSHGVAVLSRFALRRSYVIELPRKHVVFNSARRVALATTVRVDGHAVRLYSVHLDNRINPSERRAQLAPVLADARRAPAAPAIIAGDMNTSPFCWLGHVVPVPCGLQDDRLERAVRASGFDTPVRESGGTIKWLAMRLDAIYTRHVDIVAFGVGDDVRASDHLPLWADIRVGRL